MNKPVVHYDPQYSAQVHVGCAAFVTPVDHPHVSNEGLVRTSMVIAVNHITGEFETMNTLYVPIVKE